MSQLIQIITAQDAKERNRSLDAVCAGMGQQELLAEARGLDQFRRSSENLYEKVRALFFLFSIYRFQLPKASPGGGRAPIPFKGYLHLLDRRFAEAIDVFLRAQEEQGPSDAIFSALAASYHRFGFQTLADQVRRSVRSVKGNQWMFRMGHPADQPLRIRPELLRRDLGAGSYPVLHEKTPVRMDLTHSAWSDIFFLGMDYPEGAKVLNVSIDLGVHGRDLKPQPPVHAYLRVIDEPVLRLTSVDLGVTADVKSLAEVFDFARDHLGLLKAAVIAAGIVPPGIEGSGHSLEALLATLVGDGHGLELISNINDIPRGSRLAVSTNLLACLISVCMRATGQARSFDGPLEESERRLVLARAILGEWLGGSGGGWQDSGGVWPGLKLIEGALACEGDPEFGISRGRLMPTHRVLGETEVPESSRRALQESLVLVHGGMAQNVGPILEMVTEKYLLRSELEWRERGQALGILEEIMGALKQGSIPAVGAATTRNFSGPIQAIIPWASNCYTETVIERVRREFGSDFHGFMMLGGMSGGGMGFFFAPKIQERARGVLQGIMQTTKRELERGLPFAMDPVVYDFSINPDGTSCGLIPPSEALLPQGYYALTMPTLLRLDPQSLPFLRRAEMDRFGTACRNQPELGGMVQKLFDRLLPKLKQESGDSQALPELLESNGFDRAQHEQVRADLKSGRVGLAQNRLPLSTDIRDVPVSELVEASDGVPSAIRELGVKAIRSGEVAVVTLAAGVGSRWTQGAGVVKAINPFCKFGGRHRSFLETHLAKSRCAVRLAGGELPHVITTSYLTHEAIAQTLQRNANHHYPGPVILSPGKSVGLRMIPSVRDLRFAWEEMPQQRLDEQAQKMREALHRALVAWARDVGEGSDYTDNIPSQCLHPVGHWYEVPNLLRNGVLGRLLAERPGLKYLFLHNVDTVGANVDPGILGLHISGGSCLSFEVISRRLEDTGGGLALVNGRLRLVEGLAMPREEVEFQLSYYNSMTTWIDVDQLLAVFSLGRGDLSDGARVTAAIREVAAKLPTYVTLKDVKKRWGHGQEDVFPVCQFEKLWSDMSGLAEVSCKYFVVPRVRGQQLKDPAQLDGWLRDGSAAHVESLCDWE